MSEALWRSLQADRSAAGSLPFVVQADVQAVAQTLADEVTKSGNFRFVDLGVLRTTTLLAERGYAYHEIAMSYYVGNSLRNRRADLKNPADASAWVDEWVTRSRDTFDRFQGPDLRHVGIGRGDSAGAPFYIVVVAVSKIAHWGEQAQGLSDVEAVRRAVLKAVNAARAKEGLKPLKRRLQLEQVAQSYAEQMFREGFYGHDAPDGSDVRDRVHAVGYKPRRVAENLASGQISVEQVMEGWLSSPGHRANILHRRLSEMGVGLKVGKKDGELKILWVQVFAGRN